MFERLSYETILERMLERVPGGLDKREGSVIYDALAPAAVELQLLYIQLDGVIEETFADTASREFLIRRARERGLKPHPGTKALLKGEFDVEIPIGSRFSFEDEGDMTFTAIARMPDGAYEIECESVGVDGNVGFGALIPFDYIPDLESALITDVLIPGEDEEDTESFRERYFNSFDNQAFGGNIDDYVQKTNALPGVGSTIVTPAWAGGGTVKLTVLDSEFNKASPALIASVQEQIDPKQDSGGSGLAPIGHSVTVDTVQEVQINISMTLTYAEGSNTQTYQGIIENTVNNYLAELRKSWQSSEIIVRLVQIESRIMWISDVVDVQNTKINNVAGNVNLSRFQIPVMGVVTCD